MSSVNRIQSYEQCGDGDIGAGGLVEKRPKRCRKARQTAAD